MGSIAQNRSAVSVTQVGKYKVTIFDQEAYEASIQQYGNDEKKPAMPGTQKRYVSRVPQREKKRIASYNWISNGTTKRDVA